MLIDCDRCAVRDLQCRECVVTVLLGAEPGETQGPIHVDDDERQALGVLADSGLVPRLQLVPTAPPREVLETAEAELAARSGPARRDVS
ncbi:MAG TPA: hypothetical protein VNU26_16480 [Mycobacteriales bacterium]|nr:hypothetical protein [Mycobacteriales bacterium]